jgi:hypothetical protein
MVLLIIYYQTNNPKRKLIKYTFKMPIKMLVIVKKKTVPVSDSCTYNIIPYKQTKKESH